MEPDGTLTAARQILGGILTRKANLLGAALALALLPVPGAAFAQSAQPAVDVYTLCSFYPQGAPCAALYRQAQNDTSPAALSVRRAFEGYARYLGNAGAAGLTAQDRDYLTANGVPVPDDLSPANQTGLHNVINDPALAANAAERWRAVNNFIGRARQAELYCHFNSCGATPTPQGA